jgi:hypothetical protein
MLAGQAVTTEVIIAIMDMTRVAKRKIKESYGKGNIATAHKAEVTTKILATQRPQTLIESTQKKVSASTL